MAIESMIPGSGEKPTQAIRVDGQRTVFPAYHAHHQRVDLTAFDLGNLYFHYDQKGLLYEMPAHSFSSAIDRLQESLSQVLVHCYPLAGRLRIHGGSAHIDCNDAGATFIKATAENLTVEDVMAAAVPEVVYKLFPLEDALSVDGHRLPLLAVQVTQLRDGIFVACSVNHTVVDGASLWNFFNLWADTCSGGAETISVHPDHGCWISPARLILDPDATLVGRSFCPVLKARMFHFSQDVVKRLKDQANKDSTTVSPISSLQALCGHVWQAITRARQLGPEEPTTFQLLIDCRARLVPPLPASYFGNAIQPAAVTTTVCEVTSKDVVFPALLLHNLIKSHGDRTIRERIASWEKNPVPGQLGQLQKNVVHLGSSPRFRMYENDFGWGKPTAVRSGCANKFDGKVTAYPGKDGGGSVVFEICLTPKTMDALELDEHFLNPLIV